MPRLAPVQRKLPPRTAVPAGERRVDRFVGLTESGPGQELRRVDSQGMSADRAVLLALGGIAAAYVPFLGGGFLTDDFVHWLRLGEVRSLADLLTSPDGFGFYRPVTQASLALDAVLFGEHAAAARTINLVLHALVLAAAFVVARLVLPSRPAAAAAALAFALTPKAHPIAVLWLSARGEILMGLFAFASVGAWIQWSRGGGGRWLAVAAVCYVLALSSKEAAVLLPALLLATPGATRTRAAVARGALLLACLGALALWWRAGTGARMPFSTDAWVNLAVPLSRIAGNARNYAGRMLPGPLMLLACAVGAFALARRPDTGQSDGHAHRGTMAIVFALAWAAIFLTPVLGIPARSELYLYLPTFGCCLLAAAIGTPWIDRVVFSRAVVGWIVVCVIGAGAYQISRSAAFQADLLFSARVVEALGQAPALRGHRGPFVLVADGPGTQQFLVDAFDGYFPAVARRALGPAAFTDDSPMLRMRCRYDGGRVTLEPL